MRHVLEMSAAAGGAPPLLDTHADGSPMIWAYLFIQRSWYWRGVSLLPAVGTGTVSHSAPTGTWPMYHETGIVETSPPLRGRTYVASSAALASCTAGGASLARA